MIEFKSYCRESRVSNKKFLKIEVNMLSEIKNEMKNILDSVNEVYNVYTEKKYAREPAGFFELFKAENLLGESIITAWFISRTASSEESFSTRENLRNHTIMIFGYLGISENINSGNKFESIIEDICSAFRQNQNLNNKCLSIVPVQVESIQEKYLGSILCHYAELKLNCMEKIDHDL
jgi:DNA-directed RNA polymerase subunit F